MARVFHIQSPIFRYSIAVLLAAAAQGAGILLNRGLGIFFILYVPFILVSAFLGGLGPGLLTTILCVIEVPYFGAPGAFATEDVHSWIRLAVLLFTGITAATLFEQLRQSRIAQEHLAGELQARQEMLESIIQYAPVGIALLRGADFRFEMVNPEYQAFAPEERMIGRSVREVWPEAADLVIPLLESVRGTQTVYHAGGMAIPRGRSAGQDSLERFFDFSYVPVRTPANDQVLVVSREVTAHKRAEQALRAAHQELAAIQANAPLLLLTVDENLHVKTANQLARSFTARDPEQLAGLGPGDVLGCARSLANPAGCGHGPECPTCAIRIAATECLREGKSREAFEAWTPLGRNGKTQRRCLLVSTTPMEFGGRRALICAQDITASKLAEEELRRNAAALRVANEDLRQFAYAVTHDLQEPLRNINTSLHLIDALRKSRPDPETGALITQTMEDCHRLHKMLTDLYEYTRIGAEEKPGAGAARTDPQAALGEALANLREAVSASGADVISGAMPMVAARQVHVVQLFQNLIGNALKFRDPQRDPRIGIAAVPATGEAGFVQFTVADNGIGFDPGSASAIFDIFKRLHTSDEYPGRGMGLAIAARIVASYGGRIWAEGMPGSGATFRFTLPSFG